MRPRGIPAEKPPSVRACGGSLSRFNEAAGNTRGKLGLAWKARVVQGLLQ